MKKPVLALGVALALTLAAAVAGGAANLPGGTAIHASITGLTNGQTIGQAPITLHGTASVGIGQAVKSTTLIYVVDVSNSTASPISGSSGLCGNQSAYLLTANTTLDCEIKAIRDLNDAAIGTGTVSKVGLIAFAGTSADTSTNITSAAAANLDPVNGAALVDPSLANFTPNPTQAGSAPFAAKDNLEWALQSMYTASNSTTPPGWPFRGSTDGLTLFSAHDVGQSTNYVAALMVLKSLASTVTSGSVEVVFISDGGPNGLVTGKTFTQALNDLSPATMTMKTFAIGAGATCTNSGDPQLSAHGSLELISQHFGLANHCTLLTDPEGAVSAVPAVVASSLDSATLKVDGSPIATDLSTALPHDGPATTGLTSHATVTLTPDMDHQLCAYATGHDGGGGGNTADEGCITVHVKSAPNITLDGGDDPLTHLAGTVNEGSSFPLDASLTGTADLTWSVSKTGAGACTVLNGTSAHASFSCNDNGLATVTLVADDHYNPAITLTEHVLVKNVDPLASITIGPGPHPLAAAVGAHVDITDPGTNDTFSCDISWGDGVTTTVSAVGTACDDAHTYTSGGNYAVHVTVTDDDSGVGEASTGVTVDAPPTIDLGFGPGRDGSFTGAEGSWTTIAATIADDGSNNILWSFTPGAGTDAGATCSLSTPAAASTMIRCTDDGDYNLTVVVDDGVNPPVVGHAVYRVSNVPPVVTSVTPSVLGQTATVTASVMDAGSNDTQTCSFAWGDSSPDTTGIAVSSGTCTASHTYAPGVHTAAVTVTATDDDGGSGARSATVTLNRPPSCSTVTPSQTDLWPPDHTLRLIVLGGATDPDGDTPAYTITSVRQDEATNGLGDGDTAIDAFPAGPGAVRLRAERSGTGDGRVYTIAFTVSDGHGGSCSSSVQVTVAKSASKPAVLTPGPGWNSFQ